MFIKKYYKVRHEILKILFEHDRTFDIKVSVSEKLLHFNEISKRLKKYDKYYLLDNLHYLQEAKEIYCDMKSEDSSFALLALGRNSYTEKKFFVEGKKEYRNAFDQKLKVISTIILLFIAISSFVLNLIDTQKNKKEIETLKLQLQKIEQKPNSNK